MMILISSMDIPAVGLRLPKLLILLTALWAIISSRQFQTFIPIMSKKDNSNVIRLVRFHTSLLLIDAGMLDLLTNIDNPFPSAAAIYSIESEM